MRGFVYPSDLEKASAFCYGKFRIAEWLLAVSPPLPALYPSARPRVARVRTRNSAFAKSMTALWHPTRQSRYRYLRSTVRPQTGEGDDTPYREIYVDETFGWLPSRKVW